MHRFSELKWKSGAFYFEKSSEWICFPVSSNKTCIFSYHISHSETNLFLKVLYLSGFERRIRSVNLYQNYASYLAAWLGFEPRQSESESLVLTITLSGKRLVRAVGLEPTRHKHTPLKRACLPIPACSHICFLIKTPQKSWLIYYTCQVMFCQDFFSNFLKFFLKSRQA